MPAHPLSNAPEDLAAAARMDGYFNRWFIEPALGRGYPADMVACYGPHMPRVSAADMAAIAAPIDVVGVNYDERAVVGHDPQGGMLAQVLAARRDGVNVAGYFAWSLMDNFE